MNIDEIRELAKIVKENNLESIEIEGKDMTLKIKMPISHTQSPVAAPQPVVMQTTIMPEQPTAMPQPAAAPPKGAEINAPMVGVFYAAPSPESEPYVRVGSRVNKGDVLCIIEAMKLMNEITAEQSGEIVEICVENGSVIEFGQTLFRIV